MSRSRVKAGLSDLNPFQVHVPLLYPLKASTSSSNVFRECRKQTFAWNKLIISDPGLDKLHAQCQSGLIVCARTSCAPDFLREHILTCKKEKTLNQQLDSNSKPLNKEFLDIQANRVWIHSETPTWYDKTYSQLNQQFFNRIDKIMKKVLWIPSCSPEHPEFVVVVDNKLNFKSHLKIIYEKTN